MTFPSEQEVLCYFTDLSNAGRWGPKDSAGTLNFIDPQTRQRAAGLISSGEVVSLGWDIDTSAKPYDPISPSRMMLNLGSGIRIDEDRTGKVPPQRSRQGYASEILGIAYHGNRITHIDALAHMSWDGNLYNGYLAEACLTPSEGARVLDVRAARSIVARGVLIDVPRYRGIKWMLDGKLLGKAELQRILLTAQVSIEPGDILFLRTGNGRRIIEEGMEHLGWMPGPGAYHVANMPLFHEKCIAGIGSDTANDLNRSEYPNIPSPVHAVGVTALGLWIIDNCNLEDLAAACEAHGRWVFAVVLCAIPFTGATGSPVNPVAIF
jgi:kynurenine formamidase